MLLCSYILTYSCDMSFIFKTTENQALVRRKYIQIERDRLVKLRQKKLIENIVLPGYLVGVSKPGE